MTNTPEPPVALACEYGAIPAEARPTHLSLARDLFGTRARERVEVAGGYAFRFAAEDVADLGRFVAEERKCCPFLTFGLEVAARGGPVWLRITGPQGTRELLAAELLA